MDRHWKTIFKVTNIIENIVLFKHFNVEKVLLILSVGWKHSGLFPECPCGLTVSLHWARLSALLTSAGWGGPSWEVTARQSSVCMSCWDSHNCHGKHIKRWMCNCISACVEETSWYLNQPSNLKHLHLKLWTVTYLDQIIFFIEHFLSMKPPLTRLFLDEVSFSQQQCNDVPLGCSIDIEVVSSGIFFCYVHFHFITQLRFNFWKADLHWGPAKSKCSIDSSVQEIQFVVLQELNN